MVFLKKKVGNTLKKEENDVKEIWKRVRKRDFSGNTGLAIKNSFYQLSSDAVAKIGALLFTIIIARLLMPELFGLYSLALSTILIFSVISELGINQTIVRFISRELPRKKRKLKAYISYLGKIKFNLVLIASVLLLISARFIAERFYQKPIFLALLAGILYIATIQITGFLQFLLRASNHFESIFKREIVFQIIRIILVPLVVLFFVRHSLNSEIGLMMIILFLSIALFLSALFLFSDAKKIYVSKFDLENKSQLPKNQKHVVNKFILATAVLALSGIFFGNIDKVMLGYFVKSEFIGYYTASFSLIGSLAPILAFASIVLLPIFSTLRGRRLEEGFKKSIRLTVLFSAAIFVIVMLAAYLIIFIVYGKEYLLATNVLRVLSPLLFTIPVTGMYQSYLVSQGKPQAVSKFLVLATLLNITLNYLFITLLLPMGNLMAIYGAGTATLISQIFYMGALVISRKKLIKKRN